MQTCWYAPATNVRLCAEALCFRCDNVGVGEQPLLLPTMFGSMAGNLAVAHRKAVTADS